MVQIDLDVGRQPAYLSRIAAETTAALIGAGAAMASTGVSMTVGGKMNRRSAREARRAREWQTGEREASQAYQQQMYERQIQDTLSMRDYDNWYNSPEQQKQRMLAAGYSPMSVLSNSGIAGQSEAAPMSAPGTPGDPGASLPQMFNPVASADPSAAFARFLQSMVAEKELQAKLPVYRSEVEYKAAITATEDAIRSGKVEMQGVQIELTKSQTDVTKSQLKVMATQIEQAKAETEVAFRYMQSMDVEMDYKKFMKWLNQQNYNLQAKEVAARIMLAKATAAKTDAERAGISMDNRAKGAYYGDLGRNSHYMYQLRSQDWRTDVENRYYAGHQRRQAYLEQLAIKKGQYDVKMQLSDFGSSVLKGTQLTGSVLGVVGQIFTGYSQYAVAQYSLARRHQIMQSTANSGQLLQPIEPMEFNPFNPAY